MRYFLRFLGVCALMLIPFLACMDFGGGEETEGCGPYSFEWDNDDPCRGVVCPSDGNECTREYCSGGACRSSPIANGSRCTFDGMDGVCVTGVCGENLCEGVDCDDEPCSTGRCDYVDGLCDYEPRLPDGTVCTYDGMDGVCVSGVCGENLCEGVDCDDDDACTQGTCDYTDGTCDFTPVVCDDDNECTEDTCNSAIGCEHAAAADGTPCRGGMFTCQDGNCEGYAQDFESLHWASPTALSDDGWLVFGQVFDGSGVFKFDYGPFPAPNDGAAFSAIVMAEGGPSQGEQQLVVYSDYNCCDPDQGHRNGTDRVTSLVFQQPFALGNEISEDEVGKTLEFSFDARRGNINDPAGNSTALAFIQTVDPNAGFAKTNFVSVDMTNLPAGIWDRYSISLTIDAGLLGQYLEFGFLSTASNFDPSGVFYDNIVAVFEAP